MRRLLPALSLGALLLLASASAVAAADELAELPSPGVPAMGEDLAGDLGEPTARPPIADPDAANGPDRVARAAVDSVGQLSPVPRVRAVVGQALGQPEIPTLPAILPDHSPLVEPPPAHRPAAVRQGRDVRDLAPDRIALAAGTAPDAGTANHDPDGRGRPVTETTYGAAPGATVPAVPASPFQGVMAQAVGSSIGGGSWIAVLGCLSLAGVWAAARAAGTLSRPPLSLALLPPVPPG